MEHIDDEVIYTPVDLRTCKYGDILISKHGLRLKYLRPLSEDDYMDHEVEYPDNRGRGTRTHDGYTFRKKRMECDEDIVEIIHVNNDSIEENKSTLDVPEIISRLFDLQRFNVYPQVSGDFTEFVGYLEPNGEYVKWKDVRKLISKIRRSNGI